MMHATELLAELDLCNILLYLICIVAWDREKRKNITISVTLLAVRSFGVVAVVVETA